jgi:hypothetical protein
MNKANHIAAGANAVAVFQQECGTVEAHAIADLICDLGHLADDRGLDFLSKVKRGVGHWFAERHAQSCNSLGAEAIVEIAISPLSTNSVARSSPP